MSRVFIARKPTPEASTPQIFDARPDQLASYKTFMSNPAITQIHFNYPTADEPIIYHIKKYDGPSNPGNFCVYVNESGAQSILSNNKEELDKYLNAEAIIKKEELRLSAERAKAARMFNSYGGNRTKCSRKMKRTKRSKRSHTSKRK